MDLIDRRAAMESLTREYNRKGRRGEGLHLAWIEKAINEVPSAEPKTGRWEKMEARGRVYRCNQCGNFLDFDGVNVGRGDANYCPNCGARMEGEEE